MELQEDKAALDELRETQMRVLVKQEKLVEVQTRYYEEKYRRLMDS
jgi:uncharacterized membrane protein (DUF106 family)